MDNRQKLYLNLTQLGLILTSIISFVFFIIKKYFLEANLYELELLVLLMFSSFCGAVFLYFYPKFLRIIQVFIFFEIIFIVFVISYLLKNPLELLWVYLTLISAFIITNKKIGTILSIFSLILLFIYSKFLTLNINDFMTLLIALIVFTIFSYMSVAIIENYEKERKKYEKRIKDMAQKDYLTGIFNRRAFFELVNKNMNSKSGILMLDIDFFKKINDTYGHDVGDKVLKQFTKRVSSVLRENDIFARIGGEEFVIMMNNVDSDSLMKKAQEISNIVKNKKMENINVTVSIGGYLFNDNNIDFALKKADEALYKAKEQRDSIIILD